jgi:hypothetical protein
VGGRQNDLWSISVQDILSPEGCPAWIPVTLQSGVAPVGRSFHAACAFGSRAIVFGGISDADIHLCDTHIFDFALQSFAQPPTLNPTAAPCARASAAVTCLGNFMYLYGGSSAQDVVHSDFYRLDLTSVASAEMKLPTPSQ